MEFRKNLKKCVATFHFTQRCILFKVSMDGFPQHLRLQKKKEKVLADGRSKEMSQLVRCQCCCLLLVVFNPKLYNPMHLER